MNRVLFHTNTVPVIPGNSKYAIFIASTSLLVAPPADAASIAALTVGDIRGRCVGVRVHGYVRPSNQDITLHRCLLVNGAFESQFSVAVTAATSQTFDWKIDTGEWAVVIQAGASAPAAIAGDLSVIADRS